MKIDLIKIIKLLLLFFIIELVMGFTGRWIEFGPLSIRKILFVALTAVSYLYIIKTNKFNLTSYDKLILGFIAVNTIWVFLPIMQNGDMGYTIQEFLPLMTLILYLPLVLLLRKKIFSLDNFRTLFIRLVLILSVFHLILWGIGTYDKLIGFGIAKFMEEYINADNTTGPMPDGVFRVMFVTSFYLLVGFFFILYDIGKKNITIQNIIIFTIITLAILSTYTRGFWVAMAAGLLILNIVFLKYAIAFTKKHRIIAALVTGLILSSIVLLVMKNPDITTKITDRIASISSKQDSSNLIKMEETTSLIDKWESSIFWGHGYGTYAYDSTRVYQALPYSYEVTLPALLMKIGLVGIFIWIYFFLIIIYITYTKACINTKKTEYQFWLAGLVTFLVAIQTNPFLFNFVGMSILLYYLLEGAMIQENNKIFNKV